MIKFFRRIRKQLLSEGKLSKYLLYALGEIVLVVIGILIAIAISEWRGDVKDMQREKRLLSELRETLIQDQNIVKDEFAKVNRTLEKLYVLDSLLKLPPPEVDDELCELLGMVYGLRALDLNKATYEDLKSTGLSIVRDEAIRSQIISVFEDRYGKVEGVHINEQSINMVNRPYYLSNFIDIQFFSFARPTDVQKIWSDPYYHNIVHYRIVTLESNQVRYYTDLIEEIEELTEMISQ
jgi:hypothetical protein